MIDIIPIGPRRSDSDALLEQLPKEHRVLIRRVLKHAHEEAGVIVRQFVRIKQVNKVVRLGTLQFLRRFTRRFSPAAVPQDHFTAKRIYLEVVRDVAETVRRDQTMGGIRWRRIDNVSGAYPWLKPKLEDLASPLGPALDTCYPEPDGTLRMHGLQLLVLHAVKALAPMQRAVIDATYFPGMTRARVCQALDISPKLYDWHLQAAYKRLRELLLQTVNPQAGSPTLAFSGGDVSMSRAFAAGRDPYDELHWDDELTWWNEMYLRTQARRRQSRAQRVNKTPEHGADEAPAA